MPIPNPLKTLVVTPKDEHKPMFKTNNGFSFINPFVKKLIKEKSYEHIENFVEELALKLGVGDDVSLSFIIKDNLAIKHYT